MLHILKSKSNNILKSTLLVERKHIKTYNSKVRNNIHDLHIRSISIFPTNFFLKLRLAQLKKEMEVSQNPNKILEYIKTLTLINPKEAVLFIERGWNNNSIPLNEIFLKEYFKCIGLLKKFDSINISGLLTMLTKSLEGKEFKTMNTNETIDISKYFNQSSSLASSPLVTAGNSPSEPLYIAYQGSSWKQQAWKTLQKGITFLILISFVGTFFDEKGNISYLL